MPSESYGMCNHCGAVRRLYDCFYCGGDEEGEELCWECLQEHQTEYHNIRK